MPRTQCEGAGMIGEDRPAGRVPGTVAEDATAVAMRDVERVIVTCEIPRCDADGGAFRIDAVVGSGVTREIGAGRYGDPDLP